MVSLAHYLKDFSEPQPVDALQGFHDSLDGADMLAPPEPEAPDPEEIRREAFAEGHEAGVQEAESRFSEERAELEEAHRQQLAALAAAHESASADVIVGKVQEMTAMLAEALSHQTAAILAPLLSEAMAAKAVSDMADLVRGALEEGEAATILVRGPSGLFDVLTARMGEKAALLRHVESPDLDLTVEIHGSVLVTRISAWAASLKKVLE